jgi:hypothetical protein
LPDRLDTTERSQQRGKPILRDAEYFDVDVLRRLAAKAIAHPSADDERAPALSSGRVGESAHQLELVHELNYPKEKAGRTSGLAMNG